MSTARASTDRRTDDLSPRRPGKTQERDSPGRAEVDLVGRGIAQWRSERPDIDSSGKAVVGRLLRLEEVVLRTLNDALLPHRIKYQEYAVLATLRVAASATRWTGAACWSR